MPHLLEMDCLRMRQEALRAEQLRALELQQNLVLGKHGEKMNPAQRSPNDWTYIQGQNPVQVMGLQQPQFMYANTSNRMEIPVIDPIGVSCQNHFLGHHGQTLVNGAGIGLMESSSPTGAAPTGQRPADVLSPEQNSTLGASVVEQSAGHEIESNAEPTSGEEVLPQPEATIEPGDRRADADKGNPVGASERTCGQGSLVDGSPVGVDNTQREDPKPREQANAGCSNLSSPSFLWQGLHTAKPPWIQAGRIPGMVPVIQPMANHSTDLTGNGPSELSGAHQNNVKPSSEHTTSEQDCAVPATSDSTTSETGASLSTTRIATFNIENFYTNKLYLEKLLNKCHIVALQEHWLYHFEQKELVDFCNERGFNVALKSVDDKDPLPPQCRPRGRGGVAIIWKKDIDSMVSLVSDGGDRIQGLMIHTLYGDLCIINAYMPCRGSKDAEDSYRDVLSQITEIMNIYSSTSQFILLGDMNASLTREIPTSRDSVFREFCESQCLCMGDNYPTGDTFQHASGNSSSQIDYILCSASDGLYLVKEVAILPWDPLNTSTHFPVICQLPGITKRRQGDPGGVSRRKIRWEKLDQVGYRNHVEAGIMGITLDTESPSELNGKLQSFCDVLVAAAEKNAPQTRRGKKKRYWSEEMKGASIASKQMFFQWKKAGRPSPEHPLSVQCRIAKRHLRTIQRQQQASYRSTIYQSIMEADSSDKKLFFSLVNRRHKAGRQALSQLYVDDRYLTTEEAIREGWASYFEKLATPADNHTYDESFEQQVNWDFNLICDICANLQDSVTEISCETIEKIIKTLKNNKSCDGTGISAEHLKYGGRQVSAFIAEVLNSVFCYGKVPEMFKMGYITPIYKKQGKPLYDPNSYRRITITSLIGKVLEKYLLDTAFSELEALQNPLQKGFTKGTSATVAALLFTEAIAEARDTRSPLYTACIDASKAFDVVWHKSLLRKLYNSGLTGTNWNILQESYHAMSSVVNWCGKHSRSFTEQQGVRQGGIISPTCYKMHINPLLDLLQRSRVGLSIGNVYCGVPTVADDLLFLSHSIIDLQAMLSAQGYFAGLERYIISETKTKVFDANSPIDTDTWNQNGIFSINGKAIEVVEECTHLGIKRDSLSKSGHSTTIDDRITSARGCAYSLMGAGLHGENGGNPRFHFHYKLVYICFTSSYIWSRRPDFI